MSLLDKLRRRPSAPESFAALWSVSAAIGPPLDDDPAVAAATRTLASLPVEDVAAAAKQALVVITRLGTEGYARHLDVHPWRGPDEEFSVRRFRLARERAALRGERFVTRVLADPTALAEVPTGPELSARQIVAEDFPTYPLCAFADVLAHQRHPHLHLGDLDSGIAAINESFRAWPTMPAEHRRALRDPETVAITLHLHGYDGAPAARAATALLWDALGRPHRIDDRYDTAEIAVVVGDRWSLEAHWVPGLLLRSDVGVTLDARRADLEPLRAEDRAAALAAAGAHALLAMDVDWPRRAELEHLRDGGRRLLPAEWPQ